MQVEPGLHVNSFRIWEMSFIEQPSKSNCNGNNTNVGNSLTAHTSIIPSHKPVCFQAASAAICSCEHTAGQITTFSTLSAPGQGLSQPSFPNCCAQACATPAANPGFQNLTFILK